MEVEIGEVHSGGNMLAPEQVDAYRRTFRILNKFMVRMWKMGMGRMINLWPAVGGRIMVIKHTGRNSGRTLYAPVNYAEVDGQIDRKSVV